MRFSKWHMTKLANYTLPTPLEKANKALLEVIIRFSSWLVCRSKVSFSLPTTVMSSRLNHVKLLACPRMGWVKTLWTLNLFKILPIGATWDFPWCTNLQRQTTTRPNIRKVGQLRACVPTHWKKGYRNQACHHLTMMRYLHLYASFLEAEYSNLTTVLESFKVLWTQASIPRQTYLPEDLPTPRHSKAHHYRVNLFCTLVFGIAASNMLREAHWEQQWWAFLLQGCKIRLGCKQGF